MERNKFIRIFSRNNQIICCCCDTLITSKERMNCPPHTKCGCRPVHDDAGYHRIKDEYNNFDNTKDKIFAILTECSMAEEGLCVMSCDSCAFTVARLKYLKSSY